MLKRHGRIGLAVAAGVAMVMAVGWLIVGRTGPAAAEVTLIDERFATGAANFATSGGTWGVSGGAFHLTNPAPAERGNANTAVHSLSVTGDFTLSARARATATASAWNDFSVIFGYQDPGNYAFVSFNESTDAFTNGIFTVTAGTQTRVAALSQNIVAGQFYDVGLARAGGTVSVRLAGSVVGSANLTGFGSGKAGVGTRNDGASFDDFVVTAAGPSPSPTSSPPPSQTAWPNATNTGVPAGWTPASTRTTDLVVTTAGAVVQDIRIIGADLVINAPNVTVRRVEIQGGTVDNWPGSVCRNGLVLEDVSIVRAPGQVTTDAGFPAVGQGGYTARRVKIDGLPEGFRVGGSSDGCGEVRIEDSFALIRSPDSCTDWHGDGIQGYGGAKLTIRNVTLDLVETPACGGTAPFFYPAGQGNTAVDIDRLLVRGGGFSFRNGMPGPIANLRVVDGGWGYGPVEHDGTCPWDARLVTVDSQYRVVSTGAAIPC